MSVGLPVRHSSHHLHVPDVLRDTMPDSPARLYSVDGSSTSV